jgi:hypothetical protein
MRLAETQTLLDEIARYDGRTWAPGSKEAWHAILGRYPVGDAIQSVHEHYAINEKRVMPANIRARCIQIRDVRDASERRALEAPTAPVVTEVGREAQREIARIVGRVAARTEAAYRPTPPDVTSPTDPTSDITEAARREQMARLRALALVHA